MIAMCNKKEVTMWKNRKYVYYSLFFSALSFMIIDSAVRNITGINLFSEAEGLRIKSWEEPRTETAIDWNLFIDVSYILIGLLLIFAFVFTNWRNGFIYKAYPFAKNLFFPLYYRLESENLVPHKGYLRHLTSKKALLMCEEHLHRGTNLKLDLGNLPGFPNKNFITTACVTRSRKLSDSHYYIWVSFKNFDSLSKLIIPRYLEYLKPKKTMSHLPAT